MQESAYRHVNNLINLYGPIKVTQESFWRRVRRAECRVTTANELSCEGRISETRLEKIRKGALNNVLKCFQNPDLIAADLFVNGDPRGYALKLKLEDRRVDLYTDWGGYGIVAPEPNANL